MKFSNKIVNVLAFLLLILMLSLAFFSMRDDSITMDELAHVPAGYSYISQKDMRLNPEHPPLLKDLAGLSVWLGSKITRTSINFPSQVKSWQKDINGQWDFGREFLYQAGNDVDKIIFWARLPMLLIMFFLGLYIFKWTRQLYGDKAGLIALFLYSLSPTFLAHGYLVTTDVGAAAAFFIAIYYLVKCLQQPSKKNLMVAGLVFGLALLTKFSLVLLIPYFLFLTIAWALIEGSTQITILNEGRYLKIALIKLKQVFKYLLLLFLVGLIGMALIWPVYQFHIWNYPAARQQADANFILQSFGERHLADSTIWMADKPILRAYGQFFFGLLMVMQRAVGGNTTYFLGEISAAGWYHYFPTVFSIKVPLALLILTLIALLSAAYRIRRPFWQRFCQWTRENFDQFALVSFFILYWLITLRSNLNIGVRHILPTFPIIYVLVSGQIAKLTTNKSQNRNKLLVVGYGLLVTLLLLWYAFGTIKIYPHFLSYFNELVNGPNNGYKYVTDSNLDWGQDLKRLKQFVEENNIETIYIDYFGGDSAEYRFKEKFQPWWGDRDPNELPTDSWLAISATFLQGGRGQPAPSFKEKTGYYNWLNQYEPVTVIGNSIFVYHIE